VIGTKTPIRLSLIAIPLICSLSYGQVKDIDLKQPIGDQLGKTGVLAPGVALEGPIDANTYILGPGDQLFFRVWGNIELEHSVTVAPDGIISIPAVGELMVSGKTLSQADSLVKKSAHSAYPNARLSMRLIKVRTMKASISGVITDPGIYEVSAIDRLSTLIASAGGFPEEVKRPEETEELKKQLRSRSSAKDEEKPEEKPVKPSLRHVIITSRSGLSESVDFQKYQRTGDLNYNPVLRDGDQVHVRAMDEEVGILSIYGAVKIPGDYEFVSGDKLLDLADLAGGFQPDASVIDVSIIRFVGDKEKSRELIIDLTNPDDIGPPLEPDDRVFIRKKSDYRLKKHVRVKGEVFFPGVYPIEEYVTKLSDVIKACGGFTDRANLEGSSVTRLGMAEVKDPEFERLKLMTIGEMSDMEYEYYKTRSREEAPSVVVDFKKLFTDKDTDQDISLREHDLIEVPTLSPTVNVAGQVNNPGLIRFKPGRDFEYYIEKAGGYSWNARKGKMRLIKAQTGKWIKPKKDTPIEIGDTIFVPEKQETEYWELWKDLLLVASQIATILIVIRSVK